METAVQTFQLLYGLAWLFVLISRLPALCHLVSGNMKPRDFHRCAFWFVALTQLAFVVRWFAYPGALTTMSESEMLVWCGVYLASTLACILTVVASRYEKRLDDN